MKKSPASRLVAAALSVMMGLAFGPEAAAATESFTVQSNGKTMFDVHLLGTDFSIASGSWLNEHLEMQTPTYDLNDMMKSGLTAGLAYWADLLAPQSSNPAGLPILVTTFSKENASASAYCLDSADSNENLIVANWIQSGSSLIPLSYEMLQAAAVSANPGSEINRQTFLFVSIGTDIGAHVADNAGRGWFVDSETLLCNNEAAANLTTVIRHEMGHALGINANTDGWSEEHKTTFTAADDSKYLLEKFQTTADNRLFTNHLYDYTGTRAQDGMPIVSEAMYDYFTQNKTFTLPKSEVFLLEGDDSANPAARYAYFKGEHVSEVLNGATYFGIDGLPVNGWEEEEPELSHFHTSGMMSHQDYTNLTTFLEVELAAMQDLGYQFDRKNYYGFSEYRDGQNYDNWQGYSLRSEDGTSWIAGSPNETALGIGLDIQGSSNTIRQHADILTIGTGAAGIRVNGSENFLTVASDAAIHSDGRRGIGILVSTGKNHRLDIAGTVTAAGEGGQALQFDYGSNSSGTSRDYIGSYIYYKQTGTLRTPCNYFNGAWTYSDGGLPFEDAVENEPIDAPLLSSVNISGTVTGKENAIFISKNAFVREINFLDGARVTGGITSEWKHFDSAAYPSLRLNYNGALIDPSLYIPDLVTTLRLDGSGVRIDGDISAADNSRLFFASGDASINGRVATTSVEVKEGAVARGNATYELNTVQLAAAPGFSVDENAGRFTNAGTLAPGNSIGAITIDGDYVQTDTGTLEVEVASNGSTDTLTVLGGTASAEGSLVLKPLAGDYFSGNQTIRLADILVTENYDDVSLAVVTDDSASPTLTMSLTSSGSGGDAVYTLSYERDYASFASDKNTSAVASALQSAAPTTDGMASLLAAIDFSSPDGSDVRQALTVLQPGLHADAARSLIASQSTFTAWRHDALQRASHTCNGRYVYATPFGKHESRSAGGNGWRADEAGVFLGMESVTDGNVFSLHGTLAKKRLKAKLERGTADDASLTAGADALWRPQSSAWHLAAGVSASYDAVHAKRRAVFAESHFAANDKYSVWGLSAFAGTGVTWQTAGFTLTPYARLSTQVLRQDAVKEHSDDGAALKIRHATLQSLASSLGVRAAASAKASDGTNADFSVSTAWNHEFLSRYGKLHAAFREADNASFTTDVKPLARESAEVMASMKLEKNSFAFRATLGGEAFSGTGSEGFLQLQLGWKF